MKINYYGTCGKRVSSLKETIKYTLRIATIVTVLLATIVLAFLIGAFTFSSSTVEANNITIMVPLKSPVLDRIANCESGNGKKGSATQFRNGQVILHANRNRTTDIGKYQINMAVWGKKAGELGYNLSTENGNTKMAEWIYLNRGTSSWYSSRHCWYR